MTVALDVLLLATAWTHVLLAPYSKVEESFNLHATHDVLMYGINSTNLRNYDHFIFSGAVPRTFVGSVVLAWLSSPVIHLASHLGYMRSKSDVQIVVRLVLATLNALGLCLLRRAVSRRFGRQPSLFFTLLTCSQFHVPFWMGRTLPNMFAFLFVNLSTYLLIDRAPNSARVPARRVHLAIALLTFTAIVFRCEVVLLLFFLALQALTSYGVPVLRIIKTGILSGATSLVLTILVDSYFWDQWPLWPELASVHFNIYQGRSSEWGTSPFYSYLTVHLPKLLLSSLPFSLIGAYSDSRVRRLLLPSLGFVALVSFLAHKEWRFVVYVVPVFNIAAARGAGWMCHTPSATASNGGSKGGAKKSFKEKRTPSKSYLIFLLGVTANLLATCIFTVTSIANYPGGESLSIFNEMYAAEAKVHVHICNLAAQTGASLFLHTHAPPHLPYYAQSSRNWTYNKTELLSAQDLSSNTAITHLIAESPSMGDEWTVVRGVSGPLRWWVDPGALRAFKKKGNVRDIWKVAGVTRAEVLWILERKDG